jgi:suppressor of ftsI/bilirubin oxidase
MDRRRFLAGGIASLGAAATWQAAQVRAAAPLPAFTGGTAVPLSAVRRLIVERKDPLSGLCRYVADTGTQMIANPLLLARRGDRCNAVIENRLPQPTTVHFHGLTLSEAQDGAGFDVIAPGAQKPLAFDIKNRGALYWFHAHPHGFTAEQVHAGLASLLVVGDDDDAALDHNLALAPGNRLALALADAQVTNGVVRPYAPSPEQCLHGWFGNRMRVNGALDFAAGVAPGWVRLQLLNACNARGLLLAFRAGDDLLPFHLLGSDGGLLAAPTALDRVFVYPAERVDIALDLSAHRNVAAVGLAFDPRHQAKGGTLALLHATRAQFPPLAAAAVCAPADGATRDALPDGAELPLFTLNTSGAARTAPPLPQRLSALPEVTADTSTPTRRLRLDFDERTGFLIDQTPYRADEIAFSIARGTREVWEVRNSPLSMPHPMHLHGFGFRVLRRQGTFGPARALATAGNGRLPSDLGLKDTVVVWPNETLWLAVDFSVPADAAFAGRQRYMFHCHNLEHEDGMMMRNFAVV